MGGFVAGMGVRVLGGFCVGGMEVLVGWADPHPGRIKLPAKTPRVRKQIFPRIRFMFILPLRDDGRTGGCSK